MKIIQEFKEFALKGNVVDLAVGVIIGAAFNKIVTSVVDDLITPLIGAIPFIKMDFSNLYFPLAEKVPWGLPLKQARELGPVFAWGNFFTVVLNFTIVAMCIFALVKAINRLRRLAPPPEPAPVSPVPTREEVLLAEIRDILRSK